MNLKKLAISGVKWTGSSTAISLLMQMASIAVLSRLLSPYEFGIMGMITVVVGFGRAFADMGISNAIIYKQDSTEEELSSLYWFNLFIGILLFIVLILIEPLVEWYFREPAIRDPYYMSTFIFLLLTPGQQFQALLQKNMDFKSLSSIELFSSFLGSLVSIILAYMDYGVFALVFGQIIVVGVRSVMLLWHARQGWFPSFHFKWENLNEYLHFGLYQMGEKMLNYFASNVDYLIIGRVLGAVPLGYYTLAFKVIFQPISRINPIITRVAFPMFAKVQKDNAALRKGYSRMLQILSIVVFPFLIGVMVIAKPFIITVFGEKWIPSVILIQIMALAGCMRTLSNPSGSVILAKGRADLGFKWNLFMTGIRVVVIYWTAMMGIMPVAWGILATQIFASVLMQLIINKMLDMKTKDVLQAIYPAAMAVSFMGVCIYALDCFTGPGKIINTSILIQFIALCLWGSVAYLGMMLTIHREVSQYYFSLILNKEKGNKGDDQQVQTENTGEKT